MLEELHWVSLHLTMKFLHQPTTEVTLNIHQTLKSSDLELKRMMIISVTPTMEELDLMCKLELSLINQIMMITVTLTMEDNHQALSLEWSFLLKSKFNLKYINIRMISTIMNKMSISKPWKNWWILRKRKLKLCWKINSKLKLMSLSILKNLSRSRSNTRTRLIKILFNLKSKLKEFFKH